MADISIIELFFYGFIELFSISMLIISVVKEIPDTRAKSIIRAIYLIPGMIAAGFMATTGERITFMTTSNIIKNLNNTDTFLDQGTQTIIMLNPMWGIFHLLIFFVLFIFIINQMFNLLTKPE